MTFRLNALATSMATAGMLYDHHSLAATVRDADLQHKNQGRKTRLKFSNGTSTTRSLDNFFKNAYVGENTREPLPIDRLKDAMCDDLDYFNNVVWTAVPL